MELGIPEHTALRMLLVDNQGGAPYPYRWEAVGSNLELPDIRGYRTT